VTVLGRVKKPGKISLPATRDLVLSAAIQQAGGFDTSAKETAIRITRRLSNGGLKTREVNLHSVGAQGLVEEDVLLEPDDVVFVPELVF
jgi:protein involved in polysaccharide export with SLBB domain